MHIYLKSVLLTAALCLVVSACGSDSADPVAQTPIAVATAEPTVVATPTPADTPVVEDTATPTVELTPTAVPRPEPTPVVTAAPTVEPTPMVESTPVVEPSPEPTEVELPTFATPQPTAESTPVVQPTVESTPVVEPTPVLTPEPTPEPVEVRLLSVDEIVAAAPHLASFVQPHVPSRGDVEAELRACMELGDAVQIDPFGVSLALCSTAYRGAAYAVDFGFVEPSCVHEQIRAWLTQTDINRLIGWADQCHSQIDPNPEDHWAQRCRTIARMVTPMMAGTQDYWLTEFICIAPLAEDIDRWGRCIELIGLYVGGIRAGALARQPHNEWPITLDLGLRPEDMNYWC